MNIAAFDPGSKNLGWSIMDSETETLISCGSKVIFHLKTLEFVPHKSCSLWNVIPKLGESLGVVLCESYRPQNFRRGADQATGDVVEKLSEMFAEAKVPFILQDPTKVKMQIPDLDVALWLSAHGYPQLNKHIRDSIKHILYYLGQKRLRDAVERSKGFGRYDIDKPGFEPKEGSEK